MQTAIPPLGDAAIDTLLSQEKAEVCLVPDKRFLLIDPGPKPGTFDLKKFNREQPTAATGPRAPTQPRIGVEAPP